MKNLTFLCLILCHIFNLTAQTDSCKVLLENISGEYNGKCKNGLANGKGLAKGEDSYNGFFIDGLPDGKGTYISQNGDKYKGYWKKGLKQGAGKFVYTLNGKSNKLIGYWKNGEYAGTSNPEITYRVTCSQGIMDYKIRKIESDQNDNSNLLTITIKSRMTNFLPDDIKINISTGQLAQEGKKFVVSQYFCPMNCDISYSIPTGAFQRKSCRFIIEITEKGKYEITLSND